AVYLPRLLNEQNNGTERGAVVVFPLCAAFPFNIARSPIEISMRCLSGYDGDYRQNAFFRNRHSPPCGSPDRAWGRRSFFNVMLTIRIPTLNKTHRFCGR
ncbi:hypothetical protein, partial [Klebsiella quasipneumoniae]|uniref:hypothetical protein n=1 Tax=Klebsiella quasipneumoniae TaxID=1463165 RepID=UPI001C60DC3E